MGREFSVKIECQGSMYIEESKDRMVDVYYSIPESGTNNNTGILLYIAGFGGQADANVFKKMRNEFSDKYNLIVVQCDYFGYEFMQSNHDVLFSSLDKQKLSNILSNEDLKEIFDGERTNINQFFQAFKKNNIKHNEVYNTKVLLGEDLSNFNEMGLMQAGDNISALMNVMGEVINNGGQINFKKIILFGNSHGAYLSYLCNAIAPNLFSLLIDNSAWTDPVYLHLNRIFSRVYGILRVNIFYDYLAAYAIKDKEIFNLEYLYSKFSNNCKIISFHGKDDTLVRIEVKKRFIKNINNCTLEIIDNTKVDGEIFKNTGHGLGADFLKLFDCVLNRKDIVFDIDNRFILEDSIVFETKLKKYMIDYSNIVPQITMHSR